MSTIPAKEIAHDRHNSNGRNHGRAPPANHTRDGEDVHCFVSGGGT